MILLNLPPIELIVKEEESKKFIFCTFRQKYVSLTPEEWVRQNFLHYLTEYLMYPNSSIAVEVFIEASLRADRADGVIYGAKGKLIGIVEFKAPDVAINQSTVNQILRYNLHYKAPLLILSNGLQHVAYRIDYSKGKSIALSEIPPYQEVLTWL